MLENWQGIDPMGLSTTLDDYKNKQLLTNTNFSPKTLRQNTKKCKGLTQWEFVPLGPTLIFTTEKN